VRVTDHDGVAEPGERVREVSTGAARAAGNDHDSIAEPRFAVARDHMRIVAHQSPPSHQGDPRATSRVQ
jgi:hypothetical protein